MRLLIFLVGFTPLFCSAQDVITRVGTTFSIVELDEYKVIPNHSTNYRQGWLVGADVRFTFNKFLGLTTNLLFSQRGWRAENNNYPFTKDDIKVNYLDLSLMPTLNLKPFYIMAGSAVGLGVGGKYLRNESQGSGFYQVSNKKIVFNENKTGPHFYIDRRFDLAGLIVVGFNISKKIYVDFRYQSSINNFFIVETSRYRVWQATVGYRILKL